MRAVLLGAALLASFGCGEEVQRRPAPYQSQFSSAEMMEAQRAEGTFDEYATFPRDLYPDGPYGLEIGSVLADYRFESTNGPITIAALRRDPSRRVLWITHVTPWCPVCEQQIPVLPELYAARRDLGLEILAVVSDADPVDAARLIPDAEFPVGADTGEPPGLVADLYEAGKVWVPENTMIDLDTGRIRAEMTGWGEPEMTDLLDYLLDAR